MSTSCLQSLLPLLWTVSSGSQQWSWGRGPWFGWEEHWEYLLAHWWGPWAVCLQQLLIDRLTDRVCNPVRICLLLLVMLSESPVCCSSSPSPCPTVQHTQSPDWGEKEVDIFDSILLSWRSQMHSHFSLQEKSGSNSLCDFTIKVTQVEGNCSPYSFKCGQSWTFCYNCVLEFSPGLSQRYLMGGDWLNLCSLGGNGRKLLFHILKSHSVLFKCL